MRTFSQRLKHARETAGYDSAQQFAGVLGMEPHAYRKYERGQSEPTLETIVRICELLSIDANYLLPLTAKGKSGKHLSQNGGNGESRAA